MNTWQRRHQYTATKPCMRRMHSMVNITSCAVLPVLAKLGIQQAPQGSAPAEQRGARHAALGVLEQPPPIRQAEGQRQELGLGRQLVRDHQATCHQACDF